MKRLILFSFFNLCIISSYSQGYLWGKSIGNTGADYGRSMFVDAAGAVYTVGQFSGTVDFDPGVGVQTLTSAGLTDVFIQKLTSAGVYVFAKRIGGTGDDVGFDVAVDPSGIIYIAGSFNATVDFDPGAGTASSTSAGGTDAFVLKLTSLGNYSFHAKFGSTGNDVGATIACNSSSFCIGGTFSETVDFDPSGGTSNLLAPAAIAGFIASFTTATAFTFAAQFNQTGSGITGLSMDATGNIYSTGYVNVAGDFDPGFGTVNFTTAGITDIFVSKLTNAGGYVWGKLFGGTGGESGVSVEFDASGFIYHAGYFTGTCDFDPDGGVSNLTSGGSNDSYVCKLNSDGSLVWAKSFSGIGDDHAQTVDTDLNGNVYVGGYFRNTVDFDPGIGTQNRPVAGLIDGFVCKLNASGQYINVVQIGSAAANEVAQDLSVDASGNIHVVGYYGGTVDVDPTFATANLISAGSADIMVLKWSSCGLTPAPLNATTLTNSIICGTSGNTNLSAIGSGTIGWYSAASGGTYLGGGSTFNTGTISVPTTFYAQDSVCIASGRTAISVTFNSLAADQVVTPINTNICSGGNATITVGSTQTNVFYTLVNDATNAVVAGPTLGTGSSMNFNVSGVTATTVYNVTAQKPNIFNGALDLDGVNDYANLGGNSRGISTTMTVSAKIKTSVTPSTNQYFLSKYDGTTGFTMYIDPTGKVAFWGRDGGLVRSSGLSTTIITDNQWHEITGVVSNATGWEIYVDGVLENTGSYATNTGVGNLTNFNVGNYSTSYSPIDIDQLAIWNTALSPAQILTNTNSCLIGNEVNLTGLFKFNETAGTSVSDNSSTAVNGTLVNMTAPACWIAGAMNNSCSTYCDSEMSQLSTVTVITAPVQPTISASGATTLCSGGNVTLTASAGTTYLWSTGATTASILVSTAGTYTVQVANADGCLSVASIGTPVSVGTTPAQPTISAGGATTFCEGGSVTLTASAGTSYLWSTGATTASISPTTTGTYTVQVTNASGCQSIASSGTTVTVNALPAQPTITAGGPTTFCQGGSVTLTASAGSGYLWSDGSMSPSINISSTSTYTVQVTNAAGCQSVASAPTVVTVNTLPNAPIISPNAPTTFCDGGTVNLASSAGITYLWSNGATTYAIDLTTGGTFTVQVTGPNGCQSAPSAPTTVIVNANPIIASGTVSNPTSCTIDNGSIQVNGSGTGTVSWTGTATGTLTGVTLPATIPSLGDGSYIITFTNASTCVSNALNVSLSAPSAPATPTISAGGPTTFCAGGSVTLTASTASTYLWSNGATSASIVVSAADNYSVTITDASGCSSPSSSATAVTLIDLPVISTGTLTNPSSCTVSDGSIEIVGTDSGNLTWTGTSTGSMTGVSLPTTVGSLANGNYNFTFTAVSGCASLPITGTLTLPSAPPAPSVTAGGSTTLCDGDIVTLMASNGDSYLWSNGETTQSIDVDVAGTYTVSITDLSGCTSPSSTGTIVVVNAIPIATISLNGITLTAANTSSTYQWIDCGNANQAIPGATSQSFTPTVNGSYAVIVTQNNCSDTSTCTAITGVGIEEVASLIDIRLQPNPTLNEVTIVSDLSIEKVEVFTTSGQLVQLESTKSFNVGHLSTGVYLVKVFTADGYSTLRLIKN